MTTLREAWLKLGLQPDYKLIVEAIRAEYLGRSAPGVATTGAAIVSAGRHRWRREESAARLALYRDDVAAEIEKLIQRMYEHEDVRKDRKRVAEMIGFLNVPKRITDEVASLYATPAKRRFRDPARAEAFAAVEREVQLHSVMKEASRLTFWLNNVLLWSYAPSNGRRQLRIITPDAFDVIVNPGDKLEAVAYLIDCAPAWAPATMTNVVALPHYELWDSEVKLVLDGAGRLIGEPLEHKLGRVPGVLMSARLPVDRLLEDRAGRDIYHAARAILFLNLCMLSLSRDASEQQPWLKGALAEMAANQPQTAGRPLALPPGVDIGSLNLVTDPEHLLKVARHVVASVAQSYGMSYDQFTFQETADTASGKAYTVRRQKLTELRAEQRERALVHERDVADLLGFPDALTPDFHEVEAPMDPGEELEVAERRFNRGLDNPIAYLQRKDTDLSTADATERFVDNVSITAWLFALLRTLNLSFTATAAEPGQTPENNGRAAQHLPPRATGAATRAATEDAATAA